MKSLAIIPAEAGVPKKKRTRGVFKKPAPAVLDGARTKFTAAQAAVAIAITGKDLREVGGDLTASILSLERALAIYVAVVVLKVPKKVLGFVLHESGDAKRIRLACATIEAWREAPVIADALERVEASLPRSW